MSIELIAAIIIITLALIFYTIGVWSEHHAGILKIWHDCYYFNFKEFLMSIELIAAIIIITLALIFYTIGVWSEHHAGILKIWHVVIFYCGLICDTIGTTLMELIARSHTFTLNPVLLAIHGISGLAAILLMLFHAIWATVVIVSFWISRNFVNAFPRYLGYCCYC